MKKRQFYFAGIEMEIEMPEERFYKNEYRLAPFRVNKVYSPHVMRFQWVDEISKPQGNLSEINLVTHIYVNDNEQIRYLNVKNDDWSRASLRVSHKGKVHDIEVSKSSFPDTIALKTVLECMSLEHLLVEVNGFVLHCSYIEVGGQAILFTAPSETGKSTQAELWKKLRSASIINGDRAAVRWTGEEILAEGIPFAGSSEYCLNRSIPIRAIICLEQAPDTSIRRLYGYEAFANIWKGCSVNTWNRKDVEKASATVTHVIKQIPIFQLACTPDESAVIALEKALAESEVVR